MMVVLMIMAITLTAVATTFLYYFDRSSAKRAAEVFAQDLTGARSMAARSRQAVVMDFDEENRSYLVRVEAGDTILRRFFDGSADHTVELMDLDLDGDSLAFNSQGIADLSGSKDALGWATFNSGSYTYAVRFNSMGSSRISEQQ
jgi:type II secretory pathway pseudopilin PulG